MNDEALTCADCGERFWFRAGEQRFFAGRGLPDAPRRCAACRARRKAEGRAHRSAPRATASHPSATPATGVLCALCGAPARVPRGVGSGHRPVACEACYRWRLGLGSGLAER